MTPACMGGWCSFRDRCERHTTDDRAVVAERLCERGEERVEFLGVIPAALTRAPARLPGVA